MLRVRLVPPLIAHQIDYTDDISRSLEQLAELFEHARDGAEDENMKDDDLEDKAREHIEITE